MEILVRLPNWLGDAVMASGLICSLAKEGHAVSVMGKKGVLPLFENHPSVKRVYHLDDDVRNIDAAVLTTNSFSSAWHMFRKGVKRRIGFRNECRSLLLTDPLPWDKKDKSRHLVERYHELAYPLSIRTISAPSLFVSEKEKALVNLLYTKHGIDPGKKTVGFHSQAAYGSAKMWPKERFTALAKVLSEQGVQCLFFGTEEERLSVEEICPEGGWNFCGETTLRLLMGMIQKLDLFVTNDSGPMHVADALSVKTVSLFGSTSPTYTAPFSNKGRVLYSKTTCSPCFLRECPIHFPCMQSLEVSYVKEKVLLSLFDSARV